MSPLTSLATSTNPLSLFQTDKQQLLPPGPLLLGFVPDLPQGELVVVRLALHLVPAGGQPLPPAQHLDLVQPLQPGCPARPGPAYQGTQCVPPAPAVLALQRHQLPLTLHLQHDLPDARLLPRPSALGPCGRTRTRSVLEVGGGGDFCPNFHGRHRRHQLRLRKEEFDTESN